MANKIINTIQNISSETMRLILTVIYIVVSPLLFFSSYWHIKRRIFTNMQLTMARMDQKYILLNIDKLIFANFKTILKDRFLFLLTLLPYRILRKIVNSIIIEIEGIEKLNKALQNGRGAIIYSCHIGPYYLISPIMIFQGKKVITIEKLGFIIDPIRRFQTGRANSIFGKNALEIVSIYDDQIIRKLKKSLKLGRLAIIMADYGGNVEVRHKTVKFLGYNIVPGKGIAWLAKRTGAYIFPVFFLKGKQNKLILRIDDPHDIDCDLDIDEVTAQIYNNIQNQIISSPEKWALWMDYHLMLTSKERGW
jgi:lauroyl/myristoyl acyltransferase